MKNQIAETLIRLLDDHPYSEITVTMICGSVPVSRTAFYRYFRDKEDVLFYFVSSEYLEKCFPIFRFHLQEKGTVCFFSYILESKERYRKLCEIDKGILLYRALKAAYRIGFERRREYSLPVPVKKRSFDPEVFFEYATSGIAAVVIRWIREGMQIPPEQIAEDLFIMLSEPLGVVRDHYT